MTRRTLPSLLALATLLGAATAVAPAPAAAKSCGPIHVQFTRKPGTTRGILSWTKPRKAPKSPRYRVYNGKAVVGQTGRTQRLVRVSFGRKYRFKVRVLTHQGHTTGCSATKVVSVVYANPTMPAPVDVTELGPGKVRLSWPASTGTEAKVTGYRLYRDGALHQKPGATATDVQLKQGQTSQYAVEAVDARGHASTRSPAVTVNADHHAPAAPAAVTATNVSDRAVTLSWAAPAGQIGGYRIYRDGVPLRQVAGTTATVDNLYATHTYSFTVVAVDSFGYLSAPSQAIGVTTGSPEPTHGRAHAFLLASTDRSFQDFQEHYREIGTVYPTYYDCDLKTAALAGKDDALITAYAKARKVEVLPRFNCQSTTVVHKILTDPATRAQWLDAVAAVVDQYGYDGANIDFEAGAAADRGAYTAFVTDLADRLHAKGKKLSLAVSAKSWDQPNHPRSTIFDYVALAQHADYIFVMAWGVHWATSAPGAQDDIQWVHQVVDYIATIPNHERFVLGMQLYAMDWADHPATGERALTYEHADAIARAQSFGATPVLDPVSDAWHFTYIAADGRSRQVWFTNAATEAHRIQYATDHGMGFGFWRLGNEDQALWDDPQLAGN
jgi:spore germination protein YaaH